MNIARCALFTAGLWGILTLCVPACAQFGSSEPPLRAASTGGPRQSSEIIFYPIAPFYQSGGTIDIPPTTAGGATIHEHSSGQTLVGMLLAAETSFPSKGNSSFMLGGWYWFHSGGDLYEIHPKYYFDQHWGIQAGFLGSTHTGHTFYDAYALYSMHPNWSDSYTGHRWAIQIGLGAFIDPTGGTTADFSGFLQGSTDIAKNISLNATYWYFNDKSFKFERYGVGVGFQF